jgi:hypothetical protein
VELGGGTGQRRVQAARVDIMRPLTRTAIVKILRSQSRFRLRWIELPSSGHRNCFGRARDRVLFR